MPQRVYFRYFVNFIQFIRIEERTFYPKTQRNILYVGIHFKHIVLILLKHETHKLPLVLHLSWSISTLVFHLKFCCANKIVNHLFCNMDALVPTRILSVLYFIEMDSLRYLKIYVGPTNFNFRIGSFKFNSVNST